MDKSKKRKKQVTKTAKKIKGKKKKSGGIIKNIIIVFIALSLIGAIFGNNNSKGSAKKTEISNNFDTQKVSSDEFSEPDSKKNKKESDIEPTQYSYDILQSLFITITANTTTDDIEKYISDNNLEYTLEHYNGGSKEYKIAYEKGVLYQSDSGDYIEISFDEDEPNKIRMAQYVQNEKSGYSAVYYNHGIFWDFRDSDKMNGNYTGYYISDAFGNDEGIIIKYSNGNETKTNYFKYESAEEIIQKVINYKR